MIRPENLELLTYGTWVVKNIDYYGHDTMYFLENDSGELIKVRALQEPNHAIGSKVGLVYSGPPTVAFKK
jgi:hypothetical protein